MRPFALSIAGALLLTACTAPTEYRAAPSVASGGFSKGYSDTQTGPDRYQVRFAGNWVTPRTDVESFALYRAAEITVASGHDHFIVTDRRLDERIIRGALADWSSNSMGGSFSSVHPGFVYTAVLDIEVGTGRRPANRRDAFDAHQVLQRLNPQIGATDQNSVDQIDFSAAD